MLQSKQLLLNDFSEMTWCKSIKAAVQRCPSCSILMQFINSCKRSVGTPGCTNNRVKPWNSQTTGVAQSNFFYWRCTYVTCVLDSQNKMDTRHPLAEATLIHIRFAGKQKPRKNSSSGSFIRALAQKPCWHSLHRLSQGALHQPAMGKDFLGQRFSSNKLSEDLKLTFPTVSMRCLWGLTLCWPNPRVTAVSLPRDLCPYATFKILLLFLSEWISRSLCCSQINAFSFLSSFSLSVPLLSANPLVAIVAPSVSTASCQASWAADWKRSEMVGHGFLPCPPLLHSTAMAQHEGAHWSTHLSKCSTLKGQHLVVKFCSERLLSLRV